MTTLTFHSSILSEIKIADRTDFLIFEAQPAVDRILTLRGDLNTVFGFYLPSIRTDADGDSTTPGQDIHMDWKDDATAAIDSWFEVNVKSAWNTMTCSLNSPTLPDGYDNLSTHVDFQKQVKLSLEALFDAGDANDIYDEATSNAVVRLNEDKVTGWMAHSADSTSTDFSQLVYTGAQLIELLDAANDAGRYREVEAADDNDGVVGRHHLDLKEGDKFSVRVVVTDSTVGAADNRADWIIELEQFKKQGEDDTRKEPASELLASAAAAVGAFTAPPSS